MFIFALVFWALCFFCGALQGAWENKKLDEQGLERKKKVRRIYHTCDDGLGKYSWVEKREEWVIEKKE